MADDLDLDDFFSELAAVETAPVVEVEEATVVGPSAPPISIASSSSSSSSSTYGAPSSSSSSVTVAAAPSLIQVASSAFVPNVVTVVTQVPPVVTKTSHPVYTYADTSSFEGFQGAGADYNTANNGYNNNSSHIAEEKSNSLSQYYKNSVANNGSSSGGGSSSSSNSNSSSSSSSSGFSVGYTSTSTTSRVLPPVAPPPPPKEATKYIRKAGGEVWEDQTLKDWPEGDFRIFVGDIAKDVTTEMLIKTFHHYKSFARAKVCRTKHENKARGFGFVSFLEPMDCAKAIREMQGQYLGSRPMKISKSTWKDRDLKEVNKKEKKKRKFEKEYGIA